MVQFQQRNSKIIGIDLREDAQTLRTGREFSSYLLVQRTFDQAMAKRKMHRIFEAGCRTFDFFGSAEKIWLDCADQEKDRWGENAELISGWNTLEHFAKALKYELSSSSFFPHDFCLFYDDTGSFYEFLKLVGIRSA